MVYSLTPFLGTEVSATAVSGSTGDLDGGRTQNQGRTKRETTLNQSQSHVGSLLVHIIWVVTEEQKNCSYECRPSQSRQS